MLNRAERRRRDTEESPPRKRWVPAKDKWVFPERHRRGPKPPSSIRSVATAPPELLRSNDRDIFYSPPPVAPKFPFLLNLLPLNPPHLNHSQPSPDVLVILNRAERRRRNTEESPPRKRWVPFKGKWVFPDRHWRGTKPPSFIRSVAAAPPELLRSNHRDIFYSPPPVAPKFPFLLNLPPLNPPHLNHSQPSPDVLVMLNHAERRRRNTEESPPRKRWVPAKDKWVFPERHRRGTKPPSFIRSVAAAPPELLRSNHRDIFYSLPPLPPKFPFLLNLLPRNRPRPYRSQPSPGTPFILNRAERRRRNTEESPPRKRWVPIKHKKIFPERHRRGTQPSPELTSPARPEFPRSNHRDVRCYFHPSHPISNFSPTCRR